MAFPSGPWNEDEEGSSRGSGGSMTESFTDDEEVVMLGEPALAKAKVNSYKERLITAIKAEHMNELKEHLNRLREDREGLIEKDKLIAGLEITDMNYSKCFKLTRDDGRSFRSVFKPGDVVTLFADLGAPSRARPAPPGDGGSKDSSGRENASGGSSCSSSNRSGSSEDATADHGDGREQSDSDSWDSLSSDKPGTTAALPVMTGASGPARQQPAGAKQEEIKQAIEDRLDQLGLHRIFDGWVVSGIQDQEMVIRTRCPNAWKEVAEWESHKMALTEALQDVTFRRQMEAAHALPYLLSVSFEYAKAGPTPPTVQDVEGKLGAPEELRMRRLLLCDPAVPEDKAFATAASAEPMPWLDETARAGIEAVLVECGLNEEQRAALQEAAGRSVTLIQGPPGTGKTRVLGAAAAGLLQVLHNTAGLARKRLGLPSLNNMQVWTENEVLSWFKMFADEDLSKTAAEALQGVTGNVLLSSTDQMFYKWFKEVVDDRKPRPSGGGKKGRAKAARPGIMDCPEAKRYMEAFKAERQAALERLQRHQKEVAGSADRPGGRDMRIVMCADSNTAANRMLESLVGALPLDAPVYDIVRLGVLQEGEEGKGLAQKYHIDPRREGHDLLKVRSRLEEALMKREVTVALGKELQREVAAWASRKLTEAGKCERPRLAKAWRNLVAEVEKIITIDTCVEDYLGGDDEEWPSRQFEASRTLNKMGAELNMAALADILIPVQVVVGTNTSLGELRQVCQKYGLTFPIVIMDEAGQSSEPSSTIPLTVGAEWALLGGDMQQLPPTIKTEAAKASLGYNTETGGSQYGRLRTLGVTELALHRQYRMHPAIREFPSQAFYGGSLEEDPDRMPDMRVPTPYVPGGWPVNKRSWEPYPIVFFDMAYSREALAGTSWYNLDEAELALQLVLAMGSDPTVRSIAVLSPYRAQARFIAKYLDHIRPALERMRERGGWHAARCMSHTVDGFQGHEADVVIISTVRSNGRGDLGHVEDERRLNVAITRARRALLILGNYELLRMGDRREQLRRSNGEQFWAKLLAHLTVAADRAVLRNEQASRVQDKLPRLPKPLSVVRP